MGLHEDLIAAGLPEELFAQPAVYGQTILYTRARTQQEDNIIESIINPIAYRQLQARIEANEIPFWSIWTYQQLDTWCDDNLMTDAQIDALTLNANLKTNLKANNAFVRNAGKMLIALRNHTRLIE